MLIYEFLSRTFKEVRLGAHPMLFFRFLPQPCQ